MWNLGKWDKNYLIGTRGFSFYRYDLVERNWEESIQKDDGDEILKVDFSSAERSGSSLDFSSWFLK